MSDLPTKTGGMISWGGSPMVSLKELKPFMSDGIYKKKKLIQSYIP
jgi:hypothetical protein